MLSIIASMAQEESRQVSDNMKWRIRQDFKAGIIWGGKNSYGYRIIDKTHVIIPEEAEVVKRAFEWYVDGLGFTSIAKRLNCNGIKPMRGSKWTHSSIRSIIENINYTGNLMLQKTYVNDHIEKVTKRNKGEFPKYFVENTHEAIISMDLFEKVAQIRSERKEIYFKGGNNGKHRNYPLTGMLFCGKCGREYKHKQTKYDKFWICSNYDEFGVSGCP